MVARFATQWDTPLSGIACLAPLACQIEVLELVCFAELHNSNPGMPAGRMLCLETAPPLHSPLPFLFLPLSLLACLAFMVPSLLKVYLLMFMSTHAQ